MAIEGLPTIWLHHHTDEAKLLRDGDDGTRISCVYESVANGLKTADARLPCMTRDNWQEFEEGGNILVRFIGPGTPTEIIQTGFRAELEELVPGMTLGDLTDEQVREMGYKTLDDLVKAKELRYPIVRKIWKPESLTVAKVRFRVLDEVKNLNF